MWQAEVSWARRDRMRLGMPKRVLVVDDHPATRNLIRSVLESEKYDQFEVVEAATGAECLRAFDERSPFDLVLLDVNLPDVDGYTVCSALRSADQNVPDRLRDRQGRPHGLRLRPRGRRRLLHREADRPGRAALHGQPVHEHRPAAAEASERRIRPSPRERRRPRARSRLVVPRGRPRRDPAREPRSGRCTLGHMLKAAGHAITIVDDALQALERAASKRSPT